MRLSFFHLLAIAAVAQDATITIFRPHNATDYSVTTRRQILAGPNEYCLRTGAPAIIRVGGTSGDQTKYNASQLTRNIWPYKNLPADRLLSPFTLGTNFTDALDNVPNVRYIIHVPITNTTVDNTVAFTQAILQHIPVNKFEAIEVGNEPDLYNGQCFRGDENCRRANYTAADYVADLQTYTTTILQRVTNLPSGPIFHVGSLADSAQWSAENLYNADLGKVTRVKAFAQHYYPASIKNYPTLRGSYLNHSGSVLHKTDGNPQKNLDYFRTAKIDTPIVISEAGSSLGQQSDFQRTINDVLGDALWEIDWVLLVMSKGIARVNMNQCNGCNFASWWASGDNANIFSQYYGLMFLADWLGIGGSSRSGAFRMTSLYNDSYPNISPYATFWGGNVDRLAVVDLKSETRP